MALMQAGIVGLSRQAMRLGLLSSSYAASVNGGSLLEASGMSSPGSGAAALGASSQVLQLGGVRFYFSKKLNWKVSRKMYKDQEGAIDCHGFTYYPRFPDHQDPPIKPSKLFRVRRIRSLYGCPYWEKELIRNMKLEQRRNIAIFKNTPNVNKMLYSIKHLIEIVPITLPNGMPDSPENGILKENGEVIVYNPLKLHGEHASIESAEKETEEYNKTHIGGPTLRERLKLRWNSRYDIV